MQKTLHLKLCTFFSLCLLFNSPVTHSVSTDIADNTAIISEEKKLKSLNHSLDQRKKQQVQLQQDLDNQLKTLDKLQASLTPTQDNYFQAKRRLQSLKHRAGSTPTLEQISQIKNEEFKFILIESKYEDKNNSLLKGQEALSDIQQQHLENSKKINWLDQQITRQQNILEVSRTRAYQKRTQALRNKEAAFNADKKEIERLQALLKRRNAELTAVRQEVEKLKAALNNTPQQHAAINNNSPELQATPITASAGTTLDTTLTHAIPEKTALDKIVLKLPAATSETPTFVDNAVDAKQALAQFDQQINAVTNRNREQSDRLINVKRVNSQGAGNPKILEARGNFQYSGKLRLKGGKYEFSVGNFHQKAELPDTDRYNTYIVLYDNRPGKQPALSIFNKRLIN